MTLKKVIIILIILIAGKMLIDLLFKIKYNEKEIYEITKFALNDSIKINKGKIVVGRNIKGRLEAFIFPDSTLKLNDTSTVEYVYLRFYPEWFEKNVKPFIARKKFVYSSEIVLIGKALHDSNFRNYMHINDYPIVRKNYVPYVFKIKESGVKIRMVFKL